MDIDKLERDCITIYYEHLNFIKYFSAIHKVSAMSMLLDECCGREWTFEYDKQEQRFYMVLGNEEKVVYNDDDAAELLAEIRTYW